MLERGGRWSPFLLAALCCVALLVGARSARAASSAEGQESASLTADQLADRMAEAFKGVQTLEAVGWIHAVERRNQETRIVDSAFTLKLERPGRLSYQTWQQAPGFLVVWDGSTGWISAPGANQYQKHEGVADLEHFLPRASAVLALAGLPLSYVHNLIVADPRAAIMKGVTQAQVESPSNSPTYSLALSLPSGEVVTIFVGKKNFLPQRMLFDLTDLIRKRATEAGQTLPDDFTSTVTITLVDATVNQPIVEAAFTFSPPEGAQLVTQFGSQPLTGKVAPDFTLNDLSGKPVTVSALRGNVVLLYFWATGRPACQADMPRLEKLYEEFRQEGLTVLGVSGEEKGTVQTFLEDRGVTFAILLDPTGAARMPYQANAIPRTLIIDREGKVAADFASLPEETLLRGKLAELGIK